MYIHGLECCNMRTRNKERVTAEKVLSMVCILFQNGCSEGSKEGRRNTLTQEQSSQQFPHILLIVFHARHK